MLGKNGYIYGVSEDEVVKWNPADCSVTIKEFNLDDDHHFGKLVFAHDGNIYTANQHGQVLKFDTTSNDWTITGNKIYEDDGFFWDIL